MRKFKKRKIYISNEELEKLYLDEKLSSLQIGKIWGCDPTLIQRRLREYGIKLRYPKRRIKISRRRLYNLYINEEMSTYKIAKELGISSCCVYYKLKELKIPTRPKKIVNISKEKLKELYFNKKLSLSKIAELYNCSHSIKLDKMKKYNLDRRDKFKSNTLYQKMKFDGDFKMKAYMIGFRLGDLHERRDSNSSSIIKVGSSTTKSDQFNLMKKIYGGYGHFWYKKYGDTYSVLIHLHKSFKFLLPKEDDISLWILENDDYFFAFLGGYTDAEGNICISQGRAKFRIRTYDKNLLFKICHKLNSLGINARFNLASKKGIYKNRKHNGDCWGVFVNSKKSLLELFKFLKPYIKHKKRYNDLLNAEDNVMKRIKKHGI